MSKWVAIQNSIPCWNASSSLDCNNIIYYAITFMNDYDEQT